ncbi:Flagellar L-ring protein, partial [Clarias magur]
MLWWCCAKKVNGCDTHPHGAQSGFGSRFNFWHNVEEDDEFSGCSSAPDSAS